MKSVQRQEIHRSDVIYVTLVSLLLTSNRLHTLSFYFRCKLWTSKCRLGNIGSNSNRENANQLTQAIFKNGKVTLVSNSKIRKDIIELKLSIESVSFENQKSSRSKENTKTFLTDVGILYMSNWKIISIRNFSFGRNNL